LQKLGHDRIYFFKDLIFEHLHFRTGKAPFDATYQKRDRFGDDDTYVAMGALRQVQADRLYAAINGNGEGVTDLAEQIRTDFKTGNFSEAVSYYAKGFLSDNKLPLLWRFHLFIWFCGRFLAMRGHLGWYEELRDKWDSR